MSFKVGDKVRRSEGFEVPTEPMIESNIDWRAKCQELEARIEELETKNYQLQVKVQVRHTQLAEAGYLRDQLSRELETLRDQMARSAEDHREAMRKLEEQMQEVASDKRGLVKILARIGHHL